MLYVIIVEKSAENLRKYFHFGINPFLLPLHPGPTHAEQKQTTDF